MNAKTLLHRLVLGIGLDGYRTHHFPTIATPARQLILNRGTSDGGTPKWDLPTQRGTMLVNLMSDVLGLGVKDLVNVMRISPPQGWRDLLGSAAWWSVVGPALWISNAHWFIVVWLAGLATTFWAMFRLRIRTEHQGTAGTHRITATWWQRWTFLPHNTWCHFEHHCWPSIPCGHLPASRQLDQASRPSTVADVFASYRQSRPVISGEPLRLLESEREERDSEEQEVCHL